MADPKKKTHDKTALDLATLQQQIADLTDALQRERADTINVRRRHETELTGARTHAKVAVVRELLPVIDNLERALAHAPAELQKTDYVQGVEAIAKQLYKALNDIGVEKIKTVGKPFDPNLHDAVTMEESQGEQEIVVQELRAGYKMGNDVIRHAMVRVKAE